MIEHTGNRRVAGSIPAVPADFSNTYDHQQHVRCWKFSRLLLNLSAVARPEGEGSNATKAWILSLAPTLLSLKQLQAILLGQRQAPPHTRKTPRR